ncbi:MULTISPECIES: ATP-dependent helicase [Paenibacillus]|uniref:DNA 3'-5' helicase n=1 Tax=Paenibacillus odorifer TaxID=189426 RepID=A0ABX3HXI3_9BACL|nr:ATP-dependent helicase [Paenibacillus odorifer]OMD55302.1 DNA helicase [Paenibacillus odorifer]
MSYYKQQLAEIRKDPYQYKAYKSNKSTVVIAGPGSGKTTVLTLKIMSLLQESILFPRGLACVTYNRSAAKEFNDRLHMYGYQERSNVFLGTVHSFCIAEVIKPFAHLFDYGIPLPIRIISQREKKLIFKKTIEYLGFKEDSLSFEEMDKERTLGITGMSRVTATSNNDALAATLEYEKRIHSLGKVDYIDIVKYATILIQKEKYVRDCLEAKFPWILIDEYQDLGKPLHEMILSLITSTNIKIFTVGDPNQSIYSFNGATPHFLMELYKMPDIASFKLLTNFRSNQGIIDAYQLALPAEKIENYRAGTRIGEKAEFNFITCSEGIEEQFHKVIHKIVPDCIQSGVALNEICVLVSKNDYAKRLSERFQEANIPYHINKRKDFEVSIIVTWLIQCASWSIDYRAESFTKLFEFWARLFMQHKGYLIIDDLSEKKKFYNVLRKSELRNEKLSDWLCWIEEQLSLTILLVDSDSYPDEVENLTKLMDLATNGEFSDFSVGKFVQILKPDNQVTISTRHSSKGLEFEVVILLGMEEDNFPFYWNRISPDPNKMEEEFRVFFVCISRAKRACYLVRSLTERNKWGTIFNKKPSRFWTMLHEVYGK